jgi:hypothetical protein
VIRRALLLAMVFGIGGSGAMNADMDAALRDVDAKRDSGTQVSATWPIFHQIIAISYPKGFEPAFEKTNGGFYIQESVLHGETVDNWTQMITITGAQGLALKDTATPESMTNFLVTRRQQICPSTFSGARLPADAVAKYSGTVILIGCGGFVQSGQEHSEATLIITLKGDQDYYTVQWAQRGPGIAGPIVFDKYIWADRLQQLLPVRVCDKVEGEAAPYPSCISPKSE